MEKDDGMDSENRDRPPRAAKRFLTPFTFLSGLSRLFRSLNQTNQRNQTNQTNQMNQLNQIPTTRREMVLGAFLFQEIQNVPVFLSSLIGGVHHSSAMRSTCLPRTGFWS
jgi:hypothetical protein